MNSKKLLSLLLAFAMVLALAACGQKESAETNTNTNTNNTQQTTTNTDPTPTPTAAPAENKIIYGSTTEISGDLGNAWWTNNATDKMIRDLIDDYSVITTNQGGEFIVNDTVSSGYEVTENDDGSKTFTVHINEGLTFNNGDPINAINYVAYALVAYSPEALEAGAKTTSGAAKIVGASAYQKGEATTISGIHLLDDYTYSIQIEAEYVPYFYEADYASLTPISFKLYAPSQANITVKDDGEGVYLADGELSKDEIDASRYVYADRISAGPYTLKEIDLGGLTATFKINENYGGNFEGQKPSIETIIIVKANQETMMDELKTGSIDFLSTLTDGAQVNVALDLEATGDFYTVDYNRNGYGKLMFQCDFGPTQFKAVRHAIAYLLDRNEFANTFCQGFGSVVHGPYGISMWMYQESREELAEKLNTYSYNPDEAVKILEEDGWVLDENGNAYTSGIRYKEVTAEEAGDYKHNVTLADGRILMPLIIEWSCSEGNSVSELLAVMLANGQQTADAGMQINRNEMSFDDLLNYMYRDASQGAQYGVKTYGMYNLATNFTAAYDQSYNWVTEKGNPEYWDLGYNSNFTDDEMLDELSMKMVYGVEPGDNETYRKLWVDFIDEWNEYLPEVPLYSNVYYDVMAKKVQGIECNPLFDFQQAVVYGHIEGAQ